MCNILMSQGSENDNSVLTFSFTDSGMSMNLFLSYYSIANLCFKIASDTNLKSFGKGSKLLISEDSELLYLSR